LFQGRIVRCNAQIIDLARFESHLKIAGLAVRVTRRVVDHHLVETRGKGLDIVQAFQNRTMLEPRDGAGDEDAQMPDTRMRHIDDALPGCLERIGIGIKLANPPHCLFGRRDVVTVRGEDDQRIADALKIDGAMRIQLHLALFQPVADEQVLRDAEDFLAAERVVAIPPAFEFDEPLTLCVGMGKEGRVLIPDRLFRLQGLKILRQPGAIEPAIAQIGYHMRGPGPSRERAHHPHRAACRLARPIAER